MTHPIQTEIKGWVMQDSSGAQSAGPRARVVSGRNASDRNANFVSERTAGRSAAVSARSPLPHNAQEIGRGGGIRDSREGKGSVGASLAPRPLSSSRSVTQVCSTSSGGQASLSARQYSARMAGMLERPTNAPPGAQRSRTGGNKKSCSCNSSSNVLNLLRAGDELRQQHNVLQ